MHKEIGETIRNIRKQRNITGEQLGVKVGLSQSKISKIETGTYAHLQRQELQDILNILNTPLTIQQRLLALLGDISARHISLYSEITEASYAQEKIARSIRIYCSSVIPAILQTTEYRTAVLKLINSQDIPAKLKHTIARQDQLWDGKHQYHILISEVALYTLPSSKLVQRAQLDRLERMLSLPYVKTGIIATQQGLIAGDLCSFALFDNKTIVECLPTKEIVSHDKQEIHTYVSLFDHLQHCASYDDAARVIINRAIAHLS